MATLTAYIERHPLPAYFALAFAISWGGILALAGPGPFLGDGRQLEAVLPLVYLAMVAGPSVASLLLTALLHGRAGLRELRSRLLRWRVGARWYAAALLAAPLTVTGVLLALSLGSRDFHLGILASGDPGSLLLSGIVAGLLVGTCEELGWTGFAIPRLRTRHGVLSTGIIVGLVWGAWHYPLFAASGGASGAIPPAVLVLVLLFSFLPPFRVLMVWVHDRTGSLLVTILMHTGLVLSTLVLAPMTLSGAALVTYDLVLAAALWAVVAAIAMAGRVLR